VVALLILGFSESIVRAAVVVAIAAVGAAVLVPLFELGWALARAPHRLLADDVVAIRGMLETERAAATAQKPTTPDAPAVNVRVGVANLIRKGEDITRTGIPSRYVPAWTEEAGAFLSEHVSPRDAENFLLASRGETLATCELRLGVLRGILGRLPSDDT
jgi:hypothetical protein